MSVRTYIDKFFDTADDDLKYMYLREGFKIASIDQDLKPLVNELFLPILENEKNIQILDLICTSAYSDLIISCLNRSDLKGKKDWFDAIAIRPLFLSYFNKEKKPIVQQALLNVLTDTVSKCSDNLPYLNRDIVGIFANYIKRENEKRWNDWEILTLLVTIAYNKRCYFVSDDVLDIVFSCTKDSHSFQKYEEHILLEITKHSKASSIQSYIGQMSILQLSVITRIWYKFGNFAENDIILDNIIPILETQHHKSEFDFDILLNILKILQNLIPLYTVEIFCEDNVENSHNKIISIKGIETVFNVLLNLTSKVCKEFISKLNLLNSPGSHSSGKLEDKPDIAQDSYVNGLDVGSEEEDNILFEDENSFTGRISLEDFDIKLYNVLKIIVQLFNKIGLDESKYHVIKDDFEALFKDDKFIGDEFVNKVSLSHLLHSENEYDSLLTKINKSESLSLSDIQAIDKTEFAKFKYSILAYLLKAFSAKKSIDELQADISILTNISQFISEQEQSLLCKCILPALKINKEYMHNYKVGNIQQSIDDGITCRILAYCSISKLDLSYNIACQVLRAVLDRGIKEEEATINNISLQIITNLLAKYYDDISGLNSVWYNEVLLERVKYRISKWHDKLIAREERVKDSGPFDVSKDDLVKWQKKDEAMQTLIEIFETTYPRIQ